MREVRTDEAPFMADLCGRNLAPGNSWLQQCDPWQSSPVPPLPEVKFYHIMITILLMMISIFIKNVLVHIHVHVFVHVL